MAANWTKKANPAGTNYHFWMKGDGGNVYVYVNIQLRSPGYTATIGLGKEGSDWGMCLGEIREAVAEGVNPEEVLTVLLRKAEEKLDSFRSMVKAIPVSLP